MPASSSSQSPSPSSSPPEPNPNSQSQLTPSPSPPPPPAPKPILLAIPVPTNKKPQAFQWTPEETANLICAYQEKWYSLKKGQLKAHQWEEVTVTVAARCGYNEPTKTSTQCRHKMEKLRKRYRAEKRKGGLSIWPFFDMMDRMECGTHQPISARPVNMVRFPNSTPKYVYKDSEDDNDEDEDDHARLNSRSRSINNLLRKPTMVTRFPGSAGYPRTPVMPLSYVRRREEMVQTETDEDSDDNELLEGSKRRSGDGEERLLVGLAAEMRGFAQKIAKVEKKKMEMIRETEKQRMEMESKWTKMIMDSQRKMIDTIDNWSTARTQKKLKVRCLDGAATFDQNYYVTWGHNNIINGENEVQLLLTNTSGSGFRSMQSFASGFFEMKIKLPTGQSAGVITTFYLNSILNGFGDHDELDFEFLGGNEVKPSLQTNVYTMDNGCREERYTLPFDPTVDFHKYQILWNQHHIVFFIDDNPIREFKNYHQMGVKFPSDKMHIEATIWDGHVWAIPNGNISWEYAPFRALYRTFDIHACQYNTSNVQRCYANDLWWNWQEFSSLNDKQLADLADFRSKYLTYDYCTDPTRNGRAECHIN